MLSRLYANVGRQALLRSTVSAKKPAVCRHLHFLRSTSSLSIRGKHGIDLHKQSVLAVLSIRHSSTGNETPTSPVESLKAQETNVTSQAAEASPEIDLLSQIPDAPVPQIDTIPDFVVKLHENGEPTFASLGLGGWTPVGIVQNSLEWLHVTLNLPWWATIVVGTLILRSLMFPVIVLNQRNVAHTRNNLPAFTELQNELSVARQCGNKYEAALAAHKLQKFCKEKNINILKNFTFLFVQGPVFISMFLGLRGMANLPVESLRTGGLWWFTDLTIIDPLYLLPLITCTTVFITFELATETMASPTVSKIRNLIRFSPVIMFPFIIKFPALLLCYWTTSNFVSLLQTCILKVPQVRTYLKIPALEEQPVVAKPKAGFIDGLKESYDNIKITRELSLRESADEQQFRSAGKGAIPKTFKYDPTKGQPITAASILAKKR